MTIKIKRILVPLDGSSNSFRGLDVAIHMARQCHATITGLYVVGITKPGISEPITSPEKIFLEYAQKIMKKAKLKAAKKGILFFDRVSYGDEEKRIVDIAKSLSVTIPTGVLFSITITAPTFVSSIIFAASFIVIDASTEITDLVITSAMVIVFALLILQIYYA